MNVKRKTLLLTAGIIMLMAIIAAGLKFMPDRRLPVAQALPQKKDAEPLAQKNTAPDFKKAVKGKAKGAAAAQPEVIGRQLNHEQEEQEREEAQIQDTPEKAVVRASLEKDIRGLTEKKEKDVREFSAMMKSFDDAISNSQLPPDELKKKKVEIEAIKAMLRIDYEQKMSSADSSLKQKVEKYHELDQEQE